MNDQVASPTAALCLVLATVGLLALVVFEIMRALAVSPLDLGAMPPVSMLAVLISLNAAAALCALYSARGALRWAAIVIAGLLALFHAMHIAEHAIAGDWPLGLLIVTTMFTPSLLAALALFRGRGAQTPVAATA
ncbi:MAG: hypothetical protein AAGG11_16840 [Pseudomonadota bacterium]